MDFQYKKQNALQYYVNSSAAPQFFKKNLLGNVRNRCSELLRCANINENTVFNAKSELILMILKVNIWQYLGNFSFLQE